MLTEEKALFQVKLIIDNLPKNEYMLIPQETIDYIENNFEYDENITINPDIPLENQNIDDKTYEMLDSIIKSAENNIRSDNTSDLPQYENNVEDLNDYNDLKEENIRLKNLIELLKKENNKIPEVKNLVLEYKELLNKKDSEIEKLKDNNEKLYKLLQRIPKILRRIFISNEDVKLLDTYKKS